MGSIGLGRVADWVLGLSSTATAMLENYLPSAILAVLVILAYSILPLFSKLQSRESNTATGLSTMRKFWLFNYLVIILASCIAGSLVETTDKILDGGTCAIFSLLGESIPAQAGFWVNYMMQELLFLVPVMDMLQLVPAFLFFVGAFCCGCCGCCKFSRGGKWGRTGKIFRFIVATMQKIKYFKNYGRASIILSATFLFCCISPLILCISIPWTIIVARVWDHNDTRVRVHPLGKGFDTGGAYWALAIRQLTYSLLLSQLVLAAVHVLSQSYATGVCLLVLMFATWFRFARMAAYYGALAAELPLDVCARIDAEETPDDAFLANVAEGYAATFYGVVKAKEVDPDAVEINVK